MDTTKDKKITTEEAIKNSWESAADLGELLAHKPDDAERLVRHIDELTSYAKLLQEIAHLAVAAGLV